MKKMKSYKEAEDVIKQGLVEMFDALFAEREKLFRVIEVQKEALECMDCGCQDVAYEALAEAEKIMKE